MPSGRAEVPRSQTSTVRDSKPSPITPALTIQFDSRNSFTLPLIRNQLMTHFANHQRVGTIRGNGCAHQS